MQYISTTKEDNILHSTIFIFLLLAFLIEPDGIADGSHYGVDLFQPFHKFYGYAKYITFAVALFLALNIRKPSMMLILIIIYEGIIILSSVMNNNLTSIGVIVAAKIISLSIIAECYMKYAPYRFIKSMLYLLVSLVAINFFTLILFPDGLYIDNRWWNLNFFLGYKNRHIYYFLPCILSVSTYEYLKTERVKYTLVLLCIMFISCILNQSTTSLIVISFLLLAFLFLLRFKLPKLLNANFVFLVGFIISVIMISMTMSGTFDVYAEAIVDFFGKESDTLGSNSRGRIWIESLVLIAKSPLLGNGDIYFDVGWTTTISQVHNNYLDMFVMGGVVLLSTFACQVFLLSRRMRLICIKEVFNLTFFFLIAFSIEFLSEGRRNNYLWFPSLIIIYYIPNMIQKIKIQNTIKRLKLQKQ